MPMSPPKSRFPALRSFLSGILFELEEPDAWRAAALSKELPCIMGQVSVQTWPGLCELLGGLPSGVTLEELQEALWQQAFVDNPTRAPEHSTYRRFALLAAQMVAIGVELPSEKAKRRVAFTVLLCRI